MYSSTFPSNSALDGAGWSTPRPGRFNQVEDVVPVLQEAGFAQGQSGGVRKISPPLTGIRSHECLSRSESLYRLSYRGTLRQTSREPNCSRQANSVRVGQDNAFFPRKQLFLPRSSQPDQSTPRSYTISEP
jgi:hypothetical protein